MKCITLNATITVKIISLYVNMNKKSIIFYYLNYWKSGVKVKVGNLLASMW